MPHSPRWESPPPKVFKGPCQTYSCLPEKSSDVAQRGVFPSSPGSSCHGTGPWKRKEGEVSPAAPSTAPRSTPKPAPPQMVLLPASSPGHPQSWDWGSGPTTPASACKGSTGHADPLLSSARPPRLTGRGGSSSAPMGGGRGRGESPARSRGHCSTYLAKQK